MAPYGSHTATQSLDLFMKQNYGPLSFPLSMSLVITCSRKGLSPQSRVPLTNLPGRCLPSRLCSKDLWIICAQHRQLCACAHVCHDPHSPHLASLHALSRWLQSSRGDITTPWRWGYLVLQSLRIKTGAGNRYGLKAKYIIPPVPVITRSRRFEMTV